MFRLVDVRLVLGAFVILLLVLGTFVALAPEAAADEKPPEFLMKFGSYGSGDGQFEYPFGVAVDGEGNIYVADWNHRIQKFDPRGHFLLKFGNLCRLSFDLLGCVDPDGPGPLELGDGQFFFPNDVAVDVEGNIYVADSGNDRIQKFDPTGSFLIKWGTRGNGDGQFYEPFGVAVDGAGSAYVADRNNHRIQKFDSQGRFLLKFGSHCAISNYGQGCMDPDGPGPLELGDGQFWIPRGVAVDGEGNIYVADWNHRIQKFDSRGSFLLKWGSLGSGDGQFISPQGVAVDGEGNIYVADRENFRIQKFDPQGRFLLKWGSQGSGDGQFCLPEGVAVDGAGNAYVADSWNHRIQVFGAPPPQESPPTFLFKFGTQGIGDGLFDRPTRVAVDGEGNIYVVDTWNNRIQKFNPQGEFLLKWGIQGSGDGQFDYPWGVAVDGAGNVYVVDRQNHRIQKFDSVGTFLLKFGSLGFGDGQFVSPNGVALDEAGNVYVVDNNSRIQKFDPQGNFLLKWGSYGSGDGQFNLPLDVAVDGGGDVYVADGNDRIQKFDNQGRFLLKWGTQGSGDGQLWGPGGVAVDAAGNVYVADTGNHRIQKFDPTGRFLLKFGTQGSGDGHFSSPYGVEVDGVGNVYVADTQNNRIQVFGRSVSPTPEPVITSSLIITSPPPYSVGQTLTARFTIANKGTTAITFNRLTAGGRLDGVWDCSNTGFVCPDFTHALNVTLNPGEFYNYEGTFTPTQPGTYDFQVFYDLGEDDWHWNVPTESGVTNSVLITVSPGVGPGIIHSVEFTQAIQEWQTIGELKADLAADISAGQPPSPPVPIIKGKAAAMRVYLNEVDKKTTVQVRATGSVSGLFEYTMLPGCSPEDRRVQAQKGFLGNRGCRSVDFVFTPEDMVNTTVQVVDEHGDILGKVSFTFPTRAIAPLTVLGVRVCAVAVTEGKHICSDPENLRGIINATEKLFPVPRVIPGPFGLVTVHGWPTEEEWWDKVLDQIWKLGKQESRVHWYGLVPHVDAPAVGGLGDVPKYTSKFDETLCTEVDRGNLGRGIVCPPSRVPDEVKSADIKAFAGMGLDDVADAAMILAHELGHNLGQWHADGCQSPKYPDPGFAEAGNPGGWLNQQVGFDVQTGEVILPIDKRLLGEDLKTFDVMSYCSLDGHNIWITAYTYRELIKYLTPSDAAGMATAVASTETETASFWEVAGEVNPEDGTVSLEPLFLLDNIQGPIAPGSGEWVIRVMDGSDVVLFERLFTPEGRFISDGKVIPPTFYELVPVQEGASRIVIQDQDGAPQAEVSLIGEAPEVSVVSPAGGEMWNEVQAVRWAAVGDALVYRVEFSSDAGASWMSLAHRWEDTTLPVDFSTLPGGQAEASLIRVVASDGVNTGVAVSNPFTVSRKEPGVRILSPIDGETFHLSRPIFFNGSAFDLEDRGFLLGEAVSWYSDLDGFLGHSDSLEVRILSEGTHTITFVATDSDGNQASDGITIAVDDTPLIEWMCGDLNGDGIVNIQDVVIALQIAVGLVEPIQAQRIVGNLNQDGAINVFDTIIVLQHMVGLVPDLEGCGPP